MQSDPDLPVKEFFAAVSGSDGNPGTREKPFATLERARDAVRALKATRGDQAQGVTVWLGGGTYERSQTFELTEEDSGIEGAPVVWRAEPGAEVRLSGGQTIPPEAFRPITEPDALSRLDPCGHGEVRWADLRALGIALSGEIPARYRGAQPVPELFFSDRRMALARWPNEGWATIARIIDSGSSDQDADDPGRPGVFEYSGDRPRRWNLESGVWLQGYWCFDWAEEAIKIQAIDHEKRQITLAEPHCYSLRQGNPSPRRYRALNLLEELDAPGEYYIDRAAGRLYFWPPAEMKEARIVLATLETPVVELKDASHVTLRDLVVETAQGDGIAVSDGADIRVQACEVRNLRQTGIRVQGGGSHLIEACDVHDTGTGGLSLSGGDRRALTPAGHAAVNNHIWRFSCHQLTYANAIQLAGVGNRAAHNLIHDAPHQAISIAGNDHTFEYNEVHHVCMETDDCGALYKGRNPSCRGNMIRYNYWHDIGSPMGHGNAAVYFDDGDGGDTVFGNVFFRCGEPGRGNFGTVFSHGGHDNLAENNIFIECKRALGSSPWNDARWLAVVNGGLRCFWTEKLLEEVDITKPPYTTRYPALVGFMTPEPGQLRINRARLNVFVNCAETQSGNWEVPPPENWVVDHDPGFVDAPGADFRLRPDAEVFTKLPGFEPIPFGEIGLRGNRL